MLQSQGLVSKAGSVFGGFAAFVSSAWKAPSLDLWMVYSAFRGLFEHGLLREAFLDYQM